MSLEAIRHQHVLFGHQDALAYGYNWINEPGRSDVLETAGSYPAVYGWELGDLELGNEENLDGMNFDNMKQWIKEGYQRGGVITISWHMNNPVTSGDSWDTEEVAVPAILPGGEKHEMFKEWLDTFAAFTKKLSVTGNDDKIHAIPILFRPYHEHNCNWFWWGRGHANEEDYIELWRFTVEYLRDEKSLNNLIWVYSPDRSRTNLDNFREDFLYGYPGNEYVDMIGLDNYWDLGHPANDESPDQQMEEFVRSITYTVEIAEELNKVPALTESGREAIPDPEWRTETLLAGINANNTSRRLAYALVWRNANHEHNRPDHYYAPYPGHPSEENFREFRDHDLILLEEDLPELYTLN